MSDPSVDVLAVGAHPDDVELGCGGTLLALGRPFAILDLTRGEAGTRGTPETRAGEAAEAARRLGAACRVTLDLGDGNLRTDRDAEREVAEVIRRLRPRIVLAQMAFDRHPDHLRASRLVTDASFYAGLKSLPLELPPHRPQQVLYYPSSFTATPTFLVDVSAVFERKLEALRAYGSQFQATEGPVTFISTSGYFEGLSAVAQAFGRLVGVKYAEAFVSPVPPLVPDLVASFEGYEPGFPPGNRIPGAP